MQDQVQMALPFPVNEPVYDYRPESAERQSLDEALKTLTSSVLEIPCVIAGREVFTGRVFELRNPCAHDEVLARVHLAGPEQVKAALEASREVRADWADTSWNTRADLLLQAADLLSGPWRARLNAATMLGQGKTPHQAEIDAAAELIDFWRFNPYYAGEIIKRQPEVHAPGTWNQLDYRPLDGFVFAITPFNFTSIALNLPTAPVLMGNTVLWKPSLTQSLSAWLGFRLLERAGLPAGVINLLHGEGADVGDGVLADPGLGGIHFTGSTATFQHLWREVGTHIERYRQYPRIVGETGGKDFILAHPSADAEALTVAILRGGFEYQGQKCSAASRIYVPDSLWPALKTRLKDEIATMRLGDVRDPATFVGPVIDERAFVRVSEAVDLACAQGEVVAGGTYDRSQGWYVAPTVVRLEDPRHPLMTREIFGPLVSVFVYQDRAWSEVLDLVDQSTPYALTGAIFAEDRAAAAQALHRLRFAAGNVYLNDKPTGAVVGQQPFGGSRASGTNDKAGSELNLIRWTSPRTVKRNHRAVHAWPYPYMTR